MVLVTQVFKTVFLTLTQSVLVTVVRSISWPTAPIELSQMRPLISTIRASYWAIKAFLSCRTWARDSSRRQMWAHQKFTLICFTYNSLKISGARLMEVTSYTSKATIIRVIYRGINSSLFLILTMTTKTITWCNPKLWICNKSWVTFLIFKSNLRINNSLTVWVAKIL